MEIKLEHTPDGLASTNAAHILELSHLVRWLQGDHGAVTSVVILEHILVQIFHAMLTNTDFDVDVRIVFEQ
jgi:hypothetical protein